MEVNEKMKEMRKIGRKDGRGGGGMVLVKLESLRRRKM